MSANLLTVQCDDARVTHTRCAEEPRRKRILFLVTEDWYFASHRLEFGEELLNANYAVGVGCRFSGLQATIREQGIEVLPVDFGRETLSLRQALREGLAIRKVILTYQPDVVHLVALRPILLGWLAGLGLKRPTFVNAITGLGSMFTGDLNSLRLRLVQKAMIALMRPAFRSDKCYNVFQNAEDMQGFIDRGFATSRNSFLIRGAGIRSTSWSPQPERVGSTAVVLYVGRLLRDKGIAELVEASRLLRSKGVPHILRLVGEPDECSPKSFSRQEVRSWEEAGTIEWLGRRSDVLEQMSQANLVVLPSYREGLPKVLLEAGLARRAVVTSDVVGCREIVKHGRNGILVPPRDPVALAAAIEGLLNSPALRSRLAAAHHEIVCRDFSLEQVTRQFLDLYDVALKGVTNPALSRINA